MKVIFVSGKYRGDIEGNIETARQAAIKLWQTGYAVICPHMNTARFDGLADDVVWLKGDIEILKRCDAIYMLSNWHDSEGSRNEHQVALDSGLEIIYQNNVR